MTATLITTGIDCVISEQGPDGRWFVRFRSNNTGLHHQLYINGRLADWTDSPDQRWFFLDDPVDAPVSVVVAAVQAENRTSDLSDLLPAELRDPSWVFVPRIVRSAACRIGDEIEILGDHAAGGDLSETPLASADVWPEWVPRWRFGEDLFGQGGFGYDGACAPGMCAGSFGAGMFGIDAGLIGIEAVLAEEGTHRIVLRTRSADGQVTDSDSIYVDVAPLPSAAESISATDYDNQQKLLTLRIN